ncbi:MAG: respiratory nitrate reductase subunit gamma [Pirellulales bacterium]|nr:respiratory nitrate reductase subunit gamma [Pirellulales bacterium]
MSEYLLKCDCGSELIITTRDAGQNLTCDDCQKTVVVPTLREIKNLKPNEDSSRTVDQTRTQKNAEWSAKTGYLFGVLTIVALAAFVTGGIQSYRAYQYSLTEDFSPQMLEEGDSLIAGMGPLQLYEAWNTVKQLKLLAPETSEYQRAQVNFKKSMNAAIICYIIGSLCIIGLAVIMMMRKPKPQVE